jgi:hypothetical protein
MAVMSTGQRQTVRSELARELSSENIETPFTKDEGLLLIQFIDEALEAADSDVVSRIPPAHPGRDWIINNPVYGRRFLEAVAMKRKLVL